MWREFDTLLVLELPLCWLKQPLPVVVEGGTTVRFARARQKQRVAVVQIFQALAPLRMRARPAFRAFL